MIKLWIMKIMYENCGVKNYMKEDHRSYRCNFCSCEKKAWKTSGLYGIRTFNLFNLLRHSCSWQRWLRNPRGSGDEYYAGMPFKSYRCSVDLPHSSQRDLIASSQWNPGYTSINKRWV